MSEQSTLVMREIVSELRALPDEKIVEVLDFVQFLRARQKPKRYAPRVVDEAQWAKLFAESAEEDGELAEMGLDDYLNSLVQEDSNEKG